MKSPIKEYDLSESEAQALIDISEECNTHFAKLVETFMNRAAEAGLAERIGGAAFSVMIMSNIAKILVLCSGMPNEEIADNEMERIGYKLHEIMAIAAGEYVIKSNTTGRAKFN